MGNPFDAINNALTGKSQPARSGVSGLDTAMSAHADKVHPVGGGTTKGAQQGAAAPTSTKTRKDGSLILMGDSDYGK